jgi:hypothetical protein
MWHHHACCVELKVMMDRVDVIDYIKPFYLNIFVFCVLDPTGICLLLGSINRTLEGSDSLSFLHFHFTFSRIKRVCYELVFHSNNQKRESSDLRISCEFYLNSMELSWSRILCRACFSLH